MSNSTVVAPAKAPAPANAYNFEPAGASSPVTTTLVVRRVANFSWIGIVGLLAAFLVLAIIALVCLWYKKRAYKQALIDQREFFTAKQRKPNPRKKSESEDEESVQERSTRGRLILADYEKALGGSHTTSSESDLDICTTTNAGSRKFSGVLEQEISIPVCARDKHVVVSFKETGFNWNLGENLVDEVFYKGEGGSQMGVRYSRTEFDNLDIFSKVDHGGEAPKKKKRSGSESASLLAGHCSIAVSESPPISKWTLRTYSLPVYRAGPTEEIRKVDHSESPKYNVTDHDDSPHSLPGSPSHGGGKSLTKASSWRQKPSRLSSQSNASGASSFVVPPSTPPPPLPLPVTVEEESQTLKESRRGVVKVTEPKWSIANYAPFAPPPPLPVPNQPPSLATKPSPPPPPPPPPPPFPSLPCRKFPPPPSPPPLPSRKPTPPPSPPCSDDGKAKTVTSPPSPPPLPASSPLPGPASRPKLAPLILPGRADLGRDSQEFRRHQKMRPLHWEKLKLESHSRAMVWDTISDSMELDEEMIENLFGVTTRVASESQVVKRSSNLTAIQIEILDPKKAHNIAIQLRARGLAKATICDALLAGDGLVQENLEVLVKMTPTDEELTRFQEYQGDLTLLGPADRFVQGILQIPSAFERLRALLFKASYWEELHQIQEMIAILEMACKELKGSRTLIKLLEVVLKTGNRLNTGTFRGDARAFRLDTLLKLADVKGVDGKTTLLHFVIQEIMKAEGTRAARLAGVRNYDGHGPSSTPTSTRSSVCTSPSSTSSPLSQFARSMETEFDRCQSEITNCGSADAFRRVGMDVVRGIPSELGHVRKAGGLDVLALRLGVSRLQTGLQDAKATMAKLRARDHANISTYDVTDDVFREKMTVFVEDAEAQVSEVQSDLDLVLESVKDVSVYFYGEADVAKSTQPALKVFMVMREFLAMLEQACKDVMKANAAAAAAADTSPSKPPSGPRSLVTTQSK